MKKPNLRLRAIPTALTMLLSFCLLAGCEQSADPGKAPADQPPASQADPRTQGDHASHHQTHEEIAAATPTEQSLYQVESDWQTQTGKSIKLASLSGKPLVLAMVYASCKNACPRIIADMKQIQAEGEKKHPGAARFVLVSIDPEVDTPERLAELARKSQLNDQWLLLRGDADEVMELAALLGVKYRKISEQDYAHTNLITVLDKQGEIVHRQQGLGVDPSETVKALNTLQNAG